MSDYRKGETLYHKHLGQVIANENERPDIYFLHVLWKGYDIALAVSSLSRVNWNKKRGTYHVHD